MSDEHKPDKLVGADNWGAWKFAMRMYLTGKDLFGLVDGSEVLGEEATPKDKEAFKKRENQALAIYEKCCN